MLKMSDFGLVKRWNYLLFLVVFGLLSACSDEEFSREGAAPGATVTIDGVTIGGLSTIGVLDLGVTNLSAGGSTSVTAVLRDSTGLLYQGEVDVLFTSTCAAFGQATLTTPVTTSTGVAISTYAAQGCSGNDLITASVTIGGTTISATATVNVAPAVLGSVQFVSANPTLISLQGTGGVGLTENSTVIFKVVDETGGPISGATVLFALSTDVGGLTITPTSAITGADGNAQTVVHSGTIPTSVRVTATVTIGPTTIGTQSDLLVISTGIPDQNSFSLSAEVLNPEALIYDGVVVEVLARLADRYNNPVPDGTTVYFTTEGGSIESSCQTVAGGCTVNWYSQNPRPCGNESSWFTVVLDPSLGPNQCIASAGVNPPAPQSQLGPTPFTAPFGGRATITAMAVGEESYIDINSNGVFDDGDTFTDLPQEAFRDDDEDGVKDTSEFYWDYNTNGTYQDTGDGLFNGVLCEDTVRCAVDELLHTRRSLVLVMSGSNAYAQFYSDSARTTVLNNLTLAGGESQIVYLLVSDVHNQVMPAGTTLDISTSHGRISAGNSATIPSTNYNGPYYWSFVISGDDSLTVSTSGTITLNITTPRGLTTTYNLGFTNNP